MTIGEQTVQVCNATKALSKFIDGSKNFPFLYLMNDQYDFMDVIIIGAGAAGLMVAKKLSAEGLKVCVLEARDRMEVVYIQQRNTISQQR
jgi:glutamate dehydrogenase/leucine dehydrogenase